MARKTTDKQPKALASTQSFSSLACGHIAVLKNSEAN
jgi:hypothetical protein